MRIPLPHDCEFQIQALAVKVLYYIKQKWCSGDEAIIRMLKTYEMCFFKMSSLPVPSTDRSVATPEPW